ncbi:MAG: hypothetical protein HY435_02705 [Candidatus Liptonbacteria bacterium]|nr:hypothetical protein [Candidatus Liptonbacteria bacterium]
MKTYLEVRMNGTSATFEIVPTQCRWVEIFRPMENGVSVSVHSCPDLYAARLFLTVQMHGVITREWSVRND